MIWSLVLAFAASLGLTLALEKICVRLSILDHPGERKMQTQPVPRFGGMAFFVTANVFFIAMGVLPHYFLFTSAMIYFGGLYDDLDAKNTVAIKIAFQLPAALIFAWAIYLENLNVTPAFAIVIRLLIFALLFFMTNAANLMDNLNGLTSGLSMLILGGLALVAVDFGYAFSALVLVIAIAGFFVRNYPRAKIFMGDQGSQFLGFFTTGFAILILSRLPGKSLLSFTVALLLIFALFFYDVVTVVHIRLKEKRSPFQGDRSHVSHRLMNRGLSAANTSLVLFLFQIVLTLAGILLIRDFNWG